MAAGVVVEAEVMVVAMIQGEVLDAVTSIYNSAFIVVGQTTCLLNAGTVLKNLSKLRLLILLLQLLPHFLLLLYYFHCSDISV